MVKVVGAPLVSKVEGCAFLWKDSNESNFVWTVESILVFIDGCKKNPQTKLGRVVGIWSERAETGPSQKVPTNFVMVIGTCRVLILGLDGVFLMTSRPDTQPGLRWENGEIKCHPMRTVPPNNAKHNCHGRAFIQTITRAIIWNRSFFKHYSRVGTIISQYGKGSSNKSLSKAHYIKKNGS